MASARLNPRKSVSGSGLSSRNGSTMTRVITRRLSAVGTFDAVTASSPAIDAENARADVGLSAGSLASAASSAASHCSVAVPAGNGAGASYAIACASSMVVLPSNGGRPASISYITTAAANRSVR